MTTTFELPAAADDVDLEWVTVCRFDDLQRERGVCAVVAGRQVAIIRTFTDELYAVGQRDPFSGAFVMSRGIVGSRGGAEAPVPTLHSPMFKQAFDLRTGRCFDDAAVSLPVYRIRVRDGVVAVSADPVLVEAPG